MKRTIWTLCFLACLAPFPVPGQDSNELSVTGGINEFSDIRQMLPRYLKAVGFDQLAQRRRLVEQITTGDGVRGRREHLRMVMLKNLGGLPDRTPLNPQTVGVIERTGYTIEKVIFESQPHFYVTANLYVPKTGRPPYPAILYPLGHERGGKTNPTWQQMLGSLATKGFVALTWDTVGQGERVQLYDQDLGESKVGNSTTEHTVIGTQCLVVGDDMARYTIWDGIRALDYLLSRREVDPKRVGLTGNSGGGTHTAYIAALDDRIQVAAPSCYITSWNLMLRTIGPQDAEQVLPFWLRDGVDYPDYIYAFAPKPYLMLTAIRDFFPIAGARESFAEAKKVLAAAGAANMLEMFEADDGHGYTKPRRLAAYQWFGRWLKGAEDRDPEPDVLLSTAEELRCTSTGQVATSLGGETVQSLNRNRLTAIKAKRRTEPADVRLFASELCHLAPATAPLPVRNYGMIERDGCSIEKLVYESEPGILIPALLYVPAGPGTKRPGLLMIDGSGKTESAHDALMFARSGLMVLTIDARGFGESQVNPDVNSREFDRFFGDYDDAMTALLVGKTLVGMRAGDVSRGLDLLTARAEVDPDRIYAYGRGDGAIPLLFASVLDRRIKRIALDGMLATYESVVDGGVHRGVFESVIPGILKSLDLPDLVAALSPRDVWIVSPADPVGHPLAGKKAEAAYGAALDAFRRAGAANALHFVDRKLEEAVSISLREMIAK
jgi:cephalosporin-C deacetylase-like acetyl esterase